MTFVIAPESHFSLDDGSRIMKANAVVFTAPNQVEFGEVECPDPGPDDLVIEVTHSWISNGTEGSYLRGERIEGDTPYRSGDPWPFPIVSGYQKVGVVTWTGHNVDDIAIGETVFAAFGWVKDMFESRAGQISPSVCPRDMVWKLDNIEDPLAYAGLVLTQVGFNGGSRGQIAQGEPAVVVGDGLVGQWTAQTLAWRGADVTLVGHHEDRLARFAQLSEGSVINATGVDWVGAVKDMAPNGVQISVDTVGSTDIIDQLFTVMKRCGHLVSAGFYGDKDKVALQPLRYKELSIDLVSGWIKERMDATIRMIRRGNLQTLPLITHHFPASKAREAWSLIESKSEAVLGVILDW